ncbi:glycosyltransferase family 2 protein [bacterium]|jgi:glycosyltransferase involved in cell wall biosynthesis|nr:glycosyltransferase family 2 protein [bacterium]
MSDLPVSAVIITYNEEKKIESCLKSLSWADEICVIDAKSTDRTKEICLDTSKPWSNKIRLVERPWSGFRDQRNYSIGQAKNDWVLVVDADEECTPELAERVRLMMSRSGGPEKRAYKVHRREYFMNKPIFHGMWNPSYQDRFFNRQGVQYVNEVHEYPVFAQPPGEIHESLLHKSDLTVEKYMEKLNRYTTIEARDRYEKGQRTSLFKLLGAFPAHFLKSMFYYGAYKDGIHGVIISLLEGVSRVVRQIKIWQLMQLERKN